VIEELPPHALSESKTPALMAEVVGLKFIVSVIIFPVCGKWFTVLGCAPVLDLDCRRMC